MVMVDFSGEDPDCEFAYSLRHQGWGGVIFFPKNLKNSAQTKRLVGALQKISRDHTNLPLLTGIDQEGGMTAPLSFSEALSPGNMAIAATGNEKYARESSLATALELSGLGFNIDFAPVVDVNNNPENPVIGVRSYGDDPERVASYSEEAILGYREGKICACAKHFPGHGDTMMDSHLLLPTVRHGRERLFEVELLPFRRAVSAGVESIMTAHIIFTALDSERPATLSPAVIGNLLRKDMGFTGLVITDSMAMKAIADHYGQGEAAVQSILAGADIVLGCGPHEKQIEIMEAITSALRDGRIPMERADESLERIFSLKGKLSSAGFSNQPSETFYGSRALMQRIAEESITLLRNTDRLLPLGTDIKLGVLAPRHPGGGLEPLLHGIRKRLPGAVVLEADFERNDSGFDSIRESFSDCSRILALTTSRGGISSFQEAAINALAAPEKVLIIAALHNPYHLLLFPRAGALLATYGYTESSQTALVKALFGESDTPGRLPVAMFPLFPRDAGLSLS